MQEMDCEIGGVKSGCFPSDCYTGDVSWLFGDDGGI